MSPPTQRLGLVTTGGLLLDRLNELDIAAQDVVDEISDLDSFRLRPFSQVVHLLVENRCRKWIAKHLSRKDERDSVFERFTRSFAVFQLKLYLITLPSAATRRILDRDFPDGGMNEAGLYVGEMTLVATEWPDDDTLPRMYHHQWMQYLLDSFATVEEALASLDKALPGGNCRWHFFLADGSGDAAVVEFLEGSPVILRGEKLPYKILCNDSYEAELRDLPRYRRFGGSKDPLPRYERDDPRFRWAAVMLQDYDAETTAPVDHAFAILERLDLGNNKWSTVFDIPKRKLYIRTARATEIKWIDLSAFSFECTEAPPALDIHAELRGDASGSFTPLTESANSEAIEAAWTEIDAGFLGNLFFRPKMIRGLKLAFDGPTCPSSTASQRP